MKMPLTFGPMGGGARPGGPGGPLAQGGAMRGGAMGRGGPMIPGEKPKNFKQTMKTLLTYLKPYQPAIILTLFFAIVGTVFAIIGPKLIGNAVTTLFTGVVAKISGRARSRHRL